MKFIPTLIFIVTAWNLACAQDNLDPYKHQDQDSLYLYLEKINTLHLNSVTGKYASKVKKWLKRSDKYFLDRVQDSTYFFDAGISENLNRILKNIYVPNRDIDPENFFFFIKNSFVPNAGCYGDGTFEINIGLIPFLENDDELAFILCHEIAHYLLDHSLKSANVRAESLFSKEARKKINKIARMRFGGGRAGRELIDDMSYNILDHSKYAEYEADSLGYLLFAGTPYNPNASITTLKKLGKLEDVVLQHDVKLDSVFDFEQYPFKDFWIESEATFFDQTEVIDEFKLDSEDLKTHPAIPYRIEKLQNDFKIGTRDEMDINRKNIHKKAVLQSIQYSIDFKSFDAAIYQLISNYSKKEIDEVYYYSKMATLLKGVYELKKKHQFGKYIPLTSPLSSEKNLNVIRTFLHNLELKELRKMGYFFCEKYKAKTLQNEQFKEAHDFFEQLNN